MPESVIPHSVGIIGSKSSLQIRITSATPSSARDRTILPEGLTSPNAMNLKSAILLAVCLCTPEPAAAQQIVFRHEATLKGTLAGTAFGPTHVVIRGVGDLSNRQSFSNGFYIIHDSATVSIDGVGSFDFVSPTRSFVNHSQTMAGFGRGTPAGLDLMIGPFAGPLFTWDMLSAVGPFTGAGGTVNWNLGDIVTSGGVLDVLNTVVTITFGASLCPSSGLAYCFGDGSGATCPCNASGNAGEGCANTTGTGGALLVGTGDPCFAIDSLQFEVTGVPGAKPCLLLRGDVQTANPMADGVRCVTGTLAHSQVRTTIGGATVFTDFLGQPFGAQSALGVPDSYQLIYRDPSNPCSGQGFNYSNGWTVTYLP